MASASAALPAGPAAATPDRAGGGYACAGDPPLIRWAQADREFAYLATCCRWPHTAQQRAELLAGAPGLDWPRFVRIAQRHRVEALAWHALSASGAPIPAESAAFLKDRAQRIANENLQFADASRRLAIAFAEAGIPLLFVKGLTVGALAYGTILLKAGRDVDVLIAPEDLLPAAGILRQADFDCIGPPAPDDRQLVAWHGGWKESAWRNAGGCLVELHTALADNPMLIPGIGLGSPRQDVEIARGVILPTLARDELFAYLCVHAATSAWFRLKWLADLAALLAGAGEAEIRRLYERSQALGAGRSAGASLLLCHGLLGTPVPPGLLRTLRRDPSVALLVHAARKSMTGRAVETEILQLRLGTLWMHLAQLPLLKGWRFKWREARRQLGHVYWR